MYKKTIEFEEDWLREIDGRTVASAIEYLQTLDQNKTLNYWMEGDTHGCSVESNLLQEVPMSNAEILAMLEKKYAKQIEDHEKGKKYYIESGHLDRLPILEKLISDIEVRREEVRARYGATG